MQENSMKILKNAKLKTTKSQNVTTQCCHFYVKKRNMNKIIKKKFADQRSSISFITMLLSNKMRCFIGFFIFVFFYV